MASFRFPFLTAPDGRSLSGTVIPNAGLHRPAVRFGAPTNTGVFRCKTVTPSPPAPPPATDSSVARFVMSVASVLVNFGLRTSKVDSPCG